MNKIFLKIISFLIICYSAHGQANYTFQWYKNGSEIKGATNANYFPTESGWYSVRTINQNSCLSDKSEEIYYQCIAETPIIIQSSGFKLSSSVEAKKYIWFLNNTISSDTSKSIKIKKAGSYRLKIINLNGCESELSAESVVSFNDQDSDSIEDSEDNCPKVANPDQKDWDKDGIGDVCDDSDGDLINDDLDLCPNTNPNTKVDSHGCADNQRDSDSDGITDDIDNCPALKNPAKPELILTNSYELTLKTIPTNCTYQWFMENKLIPNENSSKLFIKTNGNYSLQLTDTDGCKSLVSAIFQIIILANTEESKDLSIYPNPVNNQIKVKMPSELKLALSMTIIDNLGKTLLKSIPIANEQLISLEWLSQGSYYLVFTKLDGETYKTIKIKKE
ncbi:thrombospondin type 3 repeat-containing protein [Aquirufa regiilacus]